MYPTKKRGDVFMAKITAESREAFEKRSAVYRTTIKDILQNEKKMLDEIRKDTASAPLKKFALAEEMIYGVTNYVLVNAISVETLGVKNEDSLNEGRKLLYKAIIYLEEVVSKIIDATPKDLEKELASIESISIERRYYLTRKLGLAIRLIMDGYGDNTKWKWSFVDMQGRFSAVAKNMLDMTQASKDFFDGRAENHDVSSYYYRLLRKLLMKSADGFREKYELSTHSDEDMKNGIRFLFAYRNLLTYFAGEAEEIEDVKKKVQVWKDKMEADNKKKKSAK